MRISRTGRARSTNVPKPQAAPPQNAAAAQSAKNRPSRPPRFSRMMALLIGATLALPTALAQAAPPTTQSEADGWAPWYKAPMNPIYRSPASGFVASDPSVVFDGTNYDMFYTDVDVDAEGQPTLIARARSTDGIHWDYQGVVAQGQPDDWAASLEGAAAFNMPDGDLHVFFSGYQRPGDPVDGFPADCGLMTSASPEGDFILHPENPLLSRTPGWYDNDAVYSMDILQLDDLYYMVYAGHCYTNCVDVPAGVFVLGATSTDLIHWSKRDAPVLEANPDIPWMAAFVAEPALLAGPNGKFYLFFTAFADWEDSPPVIGIAESDTPFGPWDINPEPILVGSRRWEERWLGAPDVILEGRTLKMWYTGVSSKFITRVGYATARWPLRR